MRSQSRFALVGIVLLSLLAAGCSKPVGKATGIVTWKGSPVADAELLFESETSPDISAFGTSGGDGKYFLNYSQSGGLPPGKYKVTVTRFTLKNGKPLPTGEEGAALRGNEENVVERCYVFEKEIAEGPNSFDFELTQGKEVHKSE